jgi:hypothetical protein
MTSAAPPKTTTAALKALFFAAFTEFLLNISAPFEVSITSIRFIVDYRIKGRQVLYAKYLLRRVEPAPN